MSLLLARLSDDRAETALPEYFDGKWFIGGWNGGGLNIVSVDENGELLEISPFLPDLGLSSAMDAELGPDGHLYMLDWGQGYDGTNPALYRIEHTG